MTALSSFPNYLSDQICAFSQLRVSFGHILCFVKRRTVVSNKRRCMPWAALGLLANVGREMAADLTTNIAILCLQNVNESQKPVFFDLFLTALHEMRCINKNRQIL